jgi:hypothetical protein
MAHKRALDWVKHSLLRSTLAKMKTNGSFVWLKKDLMHDLREVVSLFEERPS